MSVNIVLKDVDRIYLAVDSQTTSGSTKIIQRNPNSIKMWNVDGIDSCYMSHCGLRRNGSLIRTIDGLIDENDNIDFAYVVKNIKRKIVQTLIEAEFIDISNNYIDKIESELFFIYKDKAYSIENDLSVVEIEDYYAHGSGRYNALGSLASTVGEPAMDRIKKALKASCNNIYVDFPVYVVDTKTNKIITINEAELRQYGKEIQKDRKQKGCA